MAGQIIINKRVYEAEDIKKLQAMNIKLQGEVNSHKHHRYMAWQIMESQKDQIAAAYRLRDALAWILKDEFVMEN